MLIAPKENLMRKVFFLVPAVLLALTIASVTFVAILMTILIQAPTTAWLGRRLGLLERS